ncbi:sugar phosphate nucleotidyltransferase [Saccharopolyspora sp. 5N708]|uniref:sugar phosphate nucleotidyltransferase n=1 Tax=Saccharopolyspora sp. 5N708 TaxID=3457424 RepID=UPI003FD3AD3C
MTARQAVVLAGGLGTRLGPLAERVPKVLQPVDGRPFLHLMLEPVVRAGLRRFHFCLGHLAEQVLPELAKVPGTATATVDPEPRGTAGALRAARSALDETFLLVLGDTYLDVDYAAVAAALPGDAGGLMVVTSADSGVTRNTIVRAGRVTSYDKSAGGAGWTDTGVCVLRRTALDGLDGLPDPLDLSTLFRALIAHRELAAWQVAAPFIDIGTPERYARLRDAVDTTGSPVSTQS